MSPAAVTSETSTGQGARGIVKEVIHPHFGSGLLLEGRRCVRPKSNPLKNNSKPRSARLLGASVRAFKALIKGRLH